MHVVQTSLFAVSKRFPDRTKAIKRLFRENEVFQGLCEDYQKCADAVEHWKRSTSEEASLLREEYQALLRDLETEIMETLRDSDK